jgi:hypothetical protein
MDRGIVLDWQVSMPRKRADLRRRMSGEAKKLSRLALSLLSRRGRASEVIRDARRGKKIVGF